jgi:hypothetical protein
MAVTESDMDLLEEYLDGALDAPSIIAIRQRLVLDSGLATAFESVRRERAIRANFFAALEPDEAAVDLFASRISKAIAAPTGQRVYLKRLAAIAACIALSFAGGYGFRGASAVKGTAISSHPIPESKHAKEYQVALVDGEDQVKAIQTFDSREKADEFTKDLGLWQERQRQLQRGAVVIVADQF